MHATPNLSDWGGDGGPGRPNQSYRLMAPDLTRCK